MGFKIDELDGTEIGISARFDGSAVVSAIEDLVTKFQQLRAAAAAAAAAPTPSGPAPGSYQNTDSSKSAAEVAAEQEAYYAGNAGGVTVNINQQLSRSDVTSIISEQARQEARK
jgi:hypothetical protein